MIALPEETRDLLTLQLIPGLGPLRITALLEHFGSPGAVLAASAEQLAGVPGIGSKLSADIVQGRREVDVAEELQLLEKHGVRLVARGTPEYPGALAEFWALCCRAGHPEQDLPRLGLPMAALRRLRYLELPPWAEVERAARALCRSEKELRTLQELWSRDEQQRHGQDGDGFGPRLKLLRLQRGIGRREVEEAALIARAEGRIIVGDGDAEGEAAGADAQRLHHPDREAPCGVVGDGSERSTVRPSKEM